MTDVRRIRDIRRQQREVLIAIDGSTVEEYTKMKRDEYERLERAGNALHDKILRELDEVITASQKAKQLNEESAKWASEGVGRYAAQLTEDPEHWAEYGIYTGAQLGDYLDACSQKDRIDD